MKLSFSTRGWEDYSFEELINLAEENAMSGIEIYDINKAPALTKKGAPFHKYNTQATGRTLLAHHLSIPALDSYIDLSKKEFDEEGLLNLFDIAESLDVPFVCVAAMTEDEEAVRNNITTILPHFEEDNVTLLIRTNGIYSDTARLRDLLDSFSNDHLAALWDVHHPYRDCNETPADTIKNLGAYVRHVHMRDSDDKENYNLIGEGNMPIDDIMRALSSIDYQLFISLEWKPCWMEDLQEPDIIFPHFVNYMERYSDSKGMRKMRYFNHDGSGQYVWKKDELINLTFPQLLDRMAEEFPDQYAFKYTTLEYTRTYEEFRDDVDALAASFISLGVRPGAKVAIWATNVPAWFLTFWAATRIGAVLVTVNTAYKVHELEYLLRQSDTHTLVMIEGTKDTNYKEIIETLCPELSNVKPGEPLHSKRLPFLRNVITVGFRMQGCLTFEEAFDRGDSVPREEVKRLASKVKPDDVCNMQYTSGTTGFPKGVMLTHYNVVNNGKCIGDRMDLSTADRMMLQVPMFHCFGMVLSMTSSMTHGATLCPMPYFSAKASLACITQEKITCFNGVPTMFIAMFNHPDYKSTDFSHMRTGIMAGAGCPPDLMKRAADPNEMNMTGIVSVYGQTESAPGTTMSSWDDPIDVRTETVGYHFAHVQCKIVDPETGETLGDDQNGEFLSKGYNTMKGYYKMPEETKKAIDPDGWLHTGDLACRDKNGNYRITGRLKDMIIRGGENIYPKEIEEFIYTHPDVQDVQVIGVPDEKYGEEAMACIILKKDKEVSEEAMRSFISASIAAHKVPRYIRFVESFPMNAAGKILKYKMREEAKEWIEGKK